MEHWGFHRYCHTLLMDAALSNCIELKPSSKGIAAHSFQQNPSLLNPSPQGGSEAIIAGYFTLCGRMVPEVLGVSAYPRHYLFEDRINLVSKKTKTNQTKKILLLCFCSKSIKHLFALLENCTAIQCVNA